MTIFAIDLGNKQTKLTDGKNTYVLPSALLPAKEVESVFALEAPDDMEEFSVSSDRATFYWGKGILDYSQDQLRDSRNYDGRYSTRIYKQLCEFSLGQLARNYDKAHDGVLSVSVVVGLPSADFENNKNIAQLKSIFVGQHLININKKPVSVRVEQLWVIPQSTGTVVDLFYKGIDFNHMDEVTEKQLDRLETLQKGIISIADIGGGTILFDTLKNGRLSNRNRKQMNTGVNELYENIANSIQAEQGFDPDIHKIEVMVREGNKNENNKQNEYSYVRSRLNQYDVTQIVQDEIEEWTAGLVDNVQSTFTSLSDVNEIVVTGGGAEIVDKDVFRHEFPQTQVTFVKGAETANVQGYYRQGELEEARVQQEQAQK